MEKYGFLTGEQLVDKGVLKLDSTLPELGLKDVQPTGSWLEQKQIQSALEARKHLVELERIEKCGSISHAVWNDELNLAEVSQKAGGHWQFIGHNVGKNLYLYPEEALYLMETNCLQLKHNEVTVSFQKAYSMLLKNETAMILYKVYSNLSRLGYKVLRHNDTKINIVKDTSEKALDEVALEGISNCISTSEKNHVQINSDDHSIIDEVISESDTNIPMEVDNNADVTREQVTEDPEDIPNLTNPVPTCNTNSANNEEKTNVKSSSPKKVPNIYNKLQRLKIKQSKNKDNQAKNFQNVVDLYRSSTVIVNAPQTNLVPQNIILTSASYTVNIENVRKSRSNSTESKAYSSSDEVNESNVRRILNTGEVHIDSIRESSRKSSFSCNSNNSNNQEWRNNSSNREWRNNSSNQEWQNSSTTQEFRNRTNNQNWNHNNYHQRWNTSQHGFSRFPSPSFSRFPSPSNYNFMRAQFNFFRHNNFPPFIMFQRLLTPHLNFQYPHTSSYRLPNFNNAFPPNATFGGRRKRKRNSLQKVALLHAIKRMANRLKLMFEAGNTQMGSILALQRLILTYNEKFHARVRLTDTFDIYDNEIILDTIELEDETPDRKKPRLEKYDENLKCIKQLATDLKDLESRNEATSRHRRALSKVVKTFNKSFNADIYINNNTEVIDKRFITLESSSDSDCIMEETSSTNVSDSNSSKMLKNPFSIFKSLTKSHLIDINSKTNDNNTDNVENGHDNQHTKYNKLSFDTFKAWLPKDYEFGAPEIANKSLMIPRLIDLKKEEYLFDYMKSNTDSFANWLDAKVHFWENLKEISDLYENESKQENDSIIQCIIKPEDCSNIAKVLNKLSIIGRYTSTGAETVLSVHFNVYNRDVKNFRKTDPPVPHFRVVCIHESASLPSGDDIEGLHKKYDDSVGLLYAIVGTASVSYLQVKPIDIPVYLPNSGSVNE